MIVKVVLPNSTIISAPSVAPRASACGRVGDNSPTIGAVTTAQIQQIVEALKFSVKLAATSIFRTTVFAE